MKLHELPRTTKPRKRVGRSISSGGGKTAGRGTKGQKSRTGKKLRYSFEGGQMPLTQRLPKRRGFKRISPKPVAISINTLIASELTAINPKTLKGAGLISSEKTPVKIIGGSASLGKLTFSEVTLTQSISKKLRGKSESKPKTEEPQAEVAETKS
jgi:large subunit ribosomal protein L15